MERLTIHTGLDNFILTGRIAQMDTNTISSIIRFDDVSQSIAMEALAQVGALHMRIHTQMERHVFLLTIRKCSLPPHPRIRGRFRITATVESQSNRTWQYRIHSYSMDAQQPVSDVSAGKIDFGGIFLFGSMDYNAQFSQKILKAHYTEVISCSLNA